MPYLVGPKNHFDPVTFGSDKNCQAAFYSLGLDRYVYPGEAKQSLYGQPTRVGLWYVPYQLESLVGLNTAKKLGLLQDLNLPLSTTADEFNAACGNRRVRILVSPKKRTPRPGREHAGLGGDLVQIERPAMGAVINRFRIRECTEIERLRNGNPVQQTVLWRNARFRITTGVPEDYFCLGRRYCHTIAWLLSAKPAPLELADPSDTYVLARLKKVIYCGVDGPPGAAVAPPPEPEAVGA